MKTLRLYHFSVQILDEATDSDEEFSSAVAQAIEVHMEALKVSVDLVGAATVQVPESEDGEYDFASA
jgi:hypothetical protein